MENGGILQDDNSIYQIDDEELSIVKAMRSVLCWSLKHKNPTMGEILEIIEEELEVIEKGGSNEGKQCYFDDEEE